MTRPGPPVDLPVVRIVHAHDALTAVLALDEAILGPEDVAAIERTLSVLEGLQAGLLS